MIVSVPVASFVCHRCLSSCGATDQEQRERGLWSQAGLDLNSTAAISSGQTTQILGWGWEQGKVERKLGSESWDLILVLRRGGGRRQGHCPMPPALSRTVGATAGHWQPSAQGTRFQGVKEDSGGLPNSFSRWSKTLLRLFSAKCKHPWKVYSVREAAWSSGEHLLWSTVESNLYTRAISLCLLISDI